MARRSRVDIQIGSKVTGALSGIKKVTQSLKSLAAPSLGKLVAGGGLVALGGLVVKTSADFETLKLRLEAVTGSANKAEKAFAETFKLFEGTPLKLRPLIQARSLLEAIGITGNKAVKAVSVAAVAFGRDVTEVALAVNSLEGESLKRLGIRLRTTGDNFSFTFGDRAGRDITRTAVGLRKARFELLKIFNIKFGGFLEKASRTLAGRFSTFVGKTEALMNKVGEQFRGDLTDILGGINRLLTEQLAKPNIAVALGQNIKKAIAFGAAAFTPEGRSAIVTDLKSTFTTLIDRLKLIFKFAADTISFKLGDSLNSFILNFKGAFTDLIADTLTVLPSRRRELQEQARGFRSEALRTTGEAPRFPDLEQLAPFFQSRAVEEGQKNIERLLKGPAQERSRFAVFQRGFDSALGRSFRELGITTGPAGAGGGQPFVKGDKLLVEIPEGKETVEVLKDIKVLLGARLVTVVQ